ncbi:MAG: HD domain-containing protein [Candidatus Gastranaerophilales bacterium]|nr:HD domain-containing protein [Candidatus Gastranaerophilales bacterium]
MKIQSITPISYKNVSADKLNNRIANSHCSTPASNSFCLPNYHPSIAIPIVSFKSNYQENSLKSAGSFEISPLWANLTVRENNLYRRENDLRSDFVRDYDRILHSNAYNKLSGKTQVFSHPESDTTSKRIHHVNQVASIAEDLSKSLGLNVELTRAIAIGHDVGHTPFGHGGERVLNAIMKDNGFKDGFWHEKNSLRFIDDIETKLDPSGYEKNLNLTYAVRDGILSHCGEIDENGIKPRTQYLDLRTIQKSNRPQPYTWEGCVVKISDKIAYLGKDLEDALNNKFLKPEKTEELKQTIKNETGLKFDTINNTVLINHFIADLRKNSSIEKGLCFSEPAFKLMNTIKKFNFENIYIPKDNIQEPYYNLAVKTVFNALDALYDGKNTVKVLTGLKESKPKLTANFIEWLIKYSNTSPAERMGRKYGNRIIYDISKKEDYRLAIIEYIASLTDKALTKSFDEIIFFG